MGSEGPLLETLTHRLSECPADFLLNPRLAAAGQAAPGAPSSLPVPAAYVGQIDVAALVCDHLRSMGQALPADAALATLHSVTGPSGLNRLRLIAIATWLLQDGFFVSRPELGPRMWPLLTGGLDEMARVVKAETAVTDGDRREELVRRCLSQLEFRPAGETKEQATDRLTRLDSIERDRVVRDIRGAEARARQVREMMAKRAAEEAAAKAARE
jgi:hypothetical protein